VYPGFHPHAYGKAVLFFRQKLFPSDRQAQEELPWIRAKTAIVRAKRYHGIVRQIDPNASSNTLDRGGPNPN
jgi:hypothetical protein